MPGCNDCRWLGSGSSCSIGHPHPLRNCVTAIMWEYVGILQPQHRVLEVGCGAWSPVRDAAVQEGYHWEGIDVNDTYQGQPTVATRVASVSRIPFPDVTFDYVIATQSMEHWEEYRVDLRKGLSEVFRVLKPGGWALINVPIHFHGGPVFVLGHLSKLRRLFDVFADGVRAEAWRYPPDPLPPCRYHLRYYWHKPALWRVSGYVLDIRARRREEIPYLDFPPLGIWHKLLAGLYYRGPLYYASLMVSEAGKRIGLKRSKTGLVARQGTGQTH